MKVSSNPSGAASGAARPMNPLITKIMRGALAAISLCLLAALVLPAQAGVALKLYYDPIPGLLVNNLTTNAIFPSAPTTYEVLANGLQEAQNFGDNFGAWTRGFIEAPQTGQYTFWVASDDEGQFWLSSNS